MTVQQSVLATNTVNDSKQTLHILINAVHSGIAPVCIANWSTLQLLHLAMMTSHEYFYTSLGYTPQRL